VSASHAANSKSSVLSSAHCERAASHAHSRCRLGGVRRFGIRWRGYQRLEDPGAKGVLGWAKAILDVLMAGLDPENKITEGDVDRMEALSAELRKFGEDVEAGRA
jgi:hypothetical protein